MQAYAEIREKDHFPPYWGYIKGLLEEAGRMSGDEDEYMESTASVGGYTTSEFVVVLKHKFAPLPNEN